MSTTGGSDDSHWARRQALLKTRESLKSMLEDPKHAHASEFVLSEMERIRTKYASPKFLDIPEPEPPPPWEDSAPSREADWTQSREEAKVLPIRSGVVVAPRTRNLVRRKLPELMAAAALEPEPTWLIERMIPSDGGVTLVGPPGAGKTFLALHIADVAAKAGRHVLFIEEEHSLKKFAARFRDLCVPETELIEAIHRGRIDAADSEGMAVIAEFLSESSNPVVIIDPYVTFARGDENDNEQATVIMDIFNGWKAMCPGLLLVVLQHMSKGAINGEVAPINAARGAGAVAGWFDVVINIRKKKESCKPGVLVSTIECAKMKDDEEFPNKEMEITLGQEIFFYEVGRQEHTKSVTQLDELRSILVKNGPLGARAARDLLSGNVTQRNLTIQLWREIYNQPVPQKLRIPDLQEKLHVD